MFTGLSAFPLTPFHNEALDYSALGRLLQNLTEARVDSICVMGSTGLYPYLTHDERHQVCQFAVEQAEGIPVMSGIGALRTYDVLKHAERAQQAGVSGLLLAPVSYHPLHQEEVLGLFEAVCHEISVPLCVYENPGVTNFTFSDALYQSIAELPNIGAIKIPGMPFETSQGSSRLANLRALMPEHVAIGVSGDKWGAAGMAAGCDLWLSVLGGLFPRTVQSLIALSQSAELDKADARVAQLAPLWELFVSSKGGMRVMATAAQIMGLTEADNLPQPLCSLRGEARDQLSHIIETMLVG